MQEGEKTSEDPEKLLRELDDGISLTALIARRDCQQKKADILRGFLSEASSLASRATRSEIRIKSTVNVAEKRKELDKLSQELRQTDSRIQQLNWLTELP